MKLFLWKDGKDVEVTLDELRKEQDNLKICPMDGGDYEELSLSEIDDEGNLHFEKLVQSTF